MHLMSLLLGGLVGALLGLAAWLSGRRLARNYRHEEKPALTEPGWRDFLAEWGIATPAALVTQALMAVWMAYVFWRRPEPPVVLATMWVTGLLLTISLVDFQVRRIPNVLVLLLLLWAPVQVVWLGWPTFAAAGLGLLVGGGVFLVLALVQRGAMGAGDVKLMVAVGAMLGYPAIWVGIFAGVLAGGVAALFLLVTRRAKRKDPMAYGPYLALGGWLAWTLSMGLWR